MTRIAYLTDTHLGCGARGYHRQPRYLDQFPTLMQRLHAWLREAKVDLLIHGGDVVDNGTPAEITHAVAQLNALPVPTAVCLGNHDLAQLDSMDHWRRLAPSLIAGGDDVLLRYSLDACDVLLLSHHWQPDQPHYWTPDRPQQPRLDEHQQTQLRRALAASPRPTLLALHAPLHAIPPHQTGQPDPLHVPHPDYVATLHRIADDHPNLRLVMTGHNHIHSMHDHGPFVSCSTAAFSERPGELRLLDIDDETIRIQTVSLAPDVGLPTELDRDAAWVAGQPADRTFALPLHALKG